MVLITVGKNHPDAVLPFGRQGKSQDGTLPPQERVGNLYQDARAVAALAVRPFAAAMAQVFQDVQRVADDVVGTASLYVHDKPNPAGIVLKGRIV